jgi:hypothetical protein
MLSLQIYAPPPLNRESSVFFFFKMPPAASRSSYVSETNVVAKVIESTFNWNPCIALAKSVEINKTFVFHPFLETTGGGGSDVRAL